MPETSKPPVHVESIDEARVCERAEARLASAEKEISTSLDNFEYDDAITAASEALRTTAKTTSKTVIKSRKNLFWARSHAYHHKGLHDLALKDAKAALNLDPSDIASYVRAAVMLKHAGHKTQALSSLEKAESLALKCETSTRAVWLQKIGTQRQKLLRTSITINGLPNEVLQHIAMLLPGRDRITMSQICRHWRQLTFSTPSMWRELTVTIASRRMPENRAVRWLAHIRRSCARANNGLTSVEFLGFFPTRLLITVLAILRRSAHSLEHISLPAWDHHACYMLLYRYCPNLKSLDLRSARGVDIEDPSLHTLRDDSDGYFPSLPTKPFSLESFRCDPLAGYSDLAEHIQSARVLLDYHPQRSLSDVQPFPTRAEIREQEGNILSCLANSLEEWALADDWPSRTWIGPQGHDEQDPPLTLTFSKLKKLDGFILNPILRFDFPELLELTDLDVAKATSRGVGRGPGIQEELVRVLNTCPKLRKLEVSMDTLDASEPDIYQALRGLRSLEQLDLRSCRDMNVVWKLLSPIAVRDSQGRAEVAVPFPNLHLLSLHAANLDITRLATVLLERDSLRKGSGWFEAKEMAATVVRSRPSASSTPTASPFQRGSSTDLARHSQRSEAGPRLENPSQLRALQSLRLYCLLERPMQVEDALRSLVPKLMLEFREL